MDRLDKWLCARTEHSRKEIKTWIRDGKVQINGIRITDPGVHVAATDSVFLNGSHICAEEFVYIMQNKPPGVVSVSRSDQEKTVVDLLPPDLRRKGLFPAGRLDKDTTGFVLITDDGEFAHRILSPRRHVTKTYTAVLRDPAGSAYREAFQRGISLADGTVCLAADLEYTDDPCIVRVFLREGRYHQVRRMFAALGNQVIALHRDAIGGLQLDASLLPGESRPLTMEELSQITNEQLS